jgi:hypothetical protein
VLAPHLTIIAIDDSNRIDDSNKIAALIRKELLNEKINLLNERTSKRAFLYSNTSVHAQKVWKYTKLAPS